MNEAQPRTPAPGGSRALQWTWVTAALVAAALLAGAGIGVVAGRASRGGRGNAQPAQPPITVSASPAPPVTISAPAPPAETVTISAAPVAPATVTVSPSLPSILTETIATPDCLRALELADQGFGVSQQGLTAAKELAENMTAAIAAVRRGNFGAAADAATELSAATETLTSVSGELNRIFGLYDAARAACVNR